MILKVILVFSLLIFSSCSSITNNSYQEKKVNNKKYKMENLKNTSKINEKKSELKYEELSKPPEAEELDKDINIKVYHTPKSPYGKKDRDIFNKKTSHMNDVEKEIEEMDTNIEFTFPD